MRQEAPLRPPALPPPPFNRLQATEAVATAAEAMAAFAATAVAVAEVAEVQVRLPLHPPQIYHPPPSMPAPPPPCRFRPVAHKPG